MAGNMGALVLQLQGDLARVDRDMKEMSRVVGGAMRQIDRAAAATSRNISGVGAAGGAIRRIEGAQEAANDIAKIGHASTASRREVLVLAHELSQGNFKRAFGSLMVLGESMDLMGKIMSPVGLAVGAFAVTIGALAVAAAKGASESNEFAKSIVLTGNYAGLTEGRFNKLAEQVAITSNTTIGNAREMTQALVSTGRIGGDAIGHVAAAAASYAALSGQKSEEVVKDFAKMADGGLKWALDFDKQTHFMTGALFDQIKALEDSGQKQKEMVVISDAIVAAEHRQQDAIEGTGGAWQSFKNWVSGATDSLEGFLGRTRTTEQQIAGLKAAIANAPKEGGLLSQGVQRRAQTPDLQAQLGQITSLQRRQELNADLQQAKANADAEVVADKEAWNKRIEAHKEGAAAMNAEIERAEREGKGAGASQTDIAAEVARIRKSYSHDGGANALEHADLDATLKPLQEQIAAEDKLLAYREQVLSGYYKRSLISEQGYYTTRETVINANTTRISALYDQEIAAVEKAAASASSAARRTELNTRADTLRNDKQQALLSSGEKVSEMTLQQAADADKYREAVEKLTSELGKLDRNAAQNAGADFDRSHSSLKKQATAQGDAGTLDTLDQARQAAVAQAQMNQLKQQAELITERLTIAEKELALAETSGNESALGGALKLSELRTQAAAQLAQLQQQMQQIADGAGLPQLTTQAAQFNLQVQDLQQSSNVLGKSVTDTFANGFAKMLDNTITRTKSLRQEFLDMANTIEQSISKIVATDLANQLFGAGGGSGSNSAGWLGQLVGFAMGFLGDTTGSENLGASGTSTPDDLMSGYTGRAGGGPVMRGSMYEVNERGPELLTVANKTFLMTGDQAGTVSQMGASGGSGHTFNMNIAVPPGTSRQSANQQAAEIMRQANTAMARNG